MKITIDKAVVEQALEALEDVDLVQYDKEFDDYYLDCCKSRAPIHSKLRHSEGCSHVKAITALRAALEASKEVEPVALYQWRIVRHGGPKEWMDTTKGWHDNNKDDPRYEFRVIHTHPAPTVPEERNSIIEECAKKCESIKGVKLQGYEFAATLRELTL